MGGKKKKEKRKKRKEKKKRKGGEQADCGGGGALLETKPAVPAGAGVALRGRGREAPATSQDVPARDEPKMFALLPPLLAYR